MTDDNDTPERERPPISEHERHRVLEWRRAAIYVFLAIDVLIVGADVGGRLFIRPDFRVDISLFGLAFGTTITLLGLEMTKFGSGSK